MKNVVVIGTQWGDEGKGKIVDLLSEKADVIVRFQGGHNAGHTLVIDENVYKLSLLPSGIIRKNKISIIGNGVVVDLFHLYDEIQGLRERNIEINPTNLIISESCFIILPIHKYIDNIRENNNNFTRIGTTGRGIGPCYEDKVGRRGIRLSDLKNKDMFERKIRDLYDYHNTWISSKGDKKVDFQIDIENIYKIYKSLEVHVLNASIKLNDLINQKKYILFEGAQGTSLDIDFGTYPYVTSSNTIAGNAAIGTGIGPRIIDYVLGITKAYTTRVGNGPFPTEDEGRVGKSLAEVGKELGTVTGRKRRCGWFDAVLVKHAVLLSSIDALALTKLDVLDQFDQIKICTNYQIGNKIIDHFPASEYEQKAVKPIFTSLPGWNEKTNGIKNYEKLPVNAKRFIEFVENCVGCNIDILSTGPDRNETIILKKIFN